MSKIKRVGCILLMLSIIEIAFSHTMLKVYADEMIANKNDKEIVTEEVQLLETESIDKSDLEKCRQILLEAGTPSEVLENSSDEQIEFIAEYLKEGEKYESMDNFEFESELVNNGISTYSLSSLSDKLIRVTIICYSYKNNGEIQYRFFPSFRWLSTNYGIKNDSFGFALYDGWEVVPGMPAQIAVYLKNSYGTTKSQIYYPIDASQYGYAYNFEAGTSVPNGYYEGHAVFYARKKKTNATNGITVKYVHDNSSWLSNITYGLSIGPASVAVSSDSPKLQVYSKNMTFAISYK
ncbi:MAG: hypothetical protein K1W00_09475 [Lachnospiraceae bacterium]